MALQDNNWGYVPPPFPQTQYTPPNPSVLAGLATLMKLIAPPTPTGSLLGNTRTTPKPQTAKPPGAPPASPTTVPQTPTPSRRPTTTTPPPGGGGSTNNGGSEMAFNDTSGFQDLGGTTNAASVGGIPSVGSSFTGAAAGLTPIGANQVYDNPAIQLQRSLAGRGIRDTAPIYESLRSLQGADPLVLYALMSQQGLGQNDAGNYINWLDQLYNQYSTVGGQSFNFNQAAGNVLGGGAEGSLLQQLLTQGDANTQVSTLYNLLGDAGRLGLNPLASRALQGSLRRLGDRYATQQATSQDPNALNQTFAAFVRANNPGIGL